MLASFAAEGALGARPSGRTTTPTTTKSRVGTYKSVYLHFLFFPRLQAKLWRGNHVLYLRVLDDFHFGCREQEKHFLVKW